MYIPAVKSFRVKLNIQINNSPKKKPGVLMPAAVKKFTMISDIPPSCFTVSNDTGIEKSKINISDKAAREILTGSLSRIIDDIATPWKRSDLPGFPLKKPKSQLKYRLQTFVSMFSWERKASYCSVVASIPASILAGSPLITLNTRKHIIDTRNMVRRAMKILLIIKFNCTISL
jgi:hypothetical protein